MAGRWEWVSVGPDLKQVAPLSWRPDGHPAAVPSQTSRW